MKSFFVFLLFSISITSCSGLITNFKRKSVARIDKEKFVFIKDTLLHKKVILENIPFNKPVVLYKTQIIKKRMIGGEFQEFYFMLWINKESNLKIARWLEKKGDELFFVNSMSENNEDYKKHYLLCVGESDCFPELIVTDSSKVWNCSKDLKCISSTLDSIQTGGCKVYKTVIIEK